MKKNLVLFTLAFAIVNSNSIEAHKHKQNPYYKNILEIPSTIKSGTKIDVACGMVNDYGWLTDNKNMITAESINDPSCSNGSYCDASHYVHISCNRNCGHKSYTDAKNKAYCTIKFKKSGIVELTQNITDNSTGTTGTGLQNTISITE